MSINISAEQVETLKNYLMRRAELTAEETGYDPAFILDGAAPHVPGRVDRRTIRNRGGMDASHGTV